MPELQFLLIAGTAVFLGSLVQTGVGLGLGLVAAPVLVLLEPPLMPGALLTTTVVLPLLTVCTEWQHIDWRGLAWGLPARIPGAVAGAWLVTALEPRVLGAAVGVSVLLGVAASLWGHGPVRLTPALLVSAGTVAGITGTATSIAGPPLALLYQHQPAARVRATLGGFFLGGTLVSLLTLAAAGELTGRQLHHGLVLVPFVVAGFLLGRPVTRRLSTTGLRTSLLWVVSFSGIALIARSLL
ncbi:sulfite exporter TauE/SafE family protein [Streptomyces sp. N2-109]|uniref:Probable membrane transporter protein n=1 Tax=Streptomyces gossypii TaxID=2883101 RepID=A0ABT2JXU0_9ACTN|nr:sulfite exporter TauE/SafE family protein [Streptomyces gossypii]MCT2592717.1 sulfite exporter TauE/SafE family protein [Streptomyces gossypii]